MTKFINVFFLLFFVSLFSCKKNDRLNQHPVPNVPVNLTINMDNPLYLRLNTPGGFVYINDYGYKGILVVNYDGENFYALDRACPYHVNEECAQVTADKSGIYFRCGRYENDEFLKCCESEFGSQGNVLKGPSQYPLKQYATYKEGNIISIAN